MGWAGVVCCAVRGETVRPESMAPPRSLVALRLVILGGVGVLKLIFSIVRSCQGNRLVRLCESCKSIADVVERARFLVKAWSRMFPVCWMLRARMWMLARCSPQEAWSCVVWIWTEGYLGVGTL